MQLKAECDNLQRQEKSCNATYHQESEVKIQNALLPYRYLEQEVESLRVVLDLRNQELAEVRQSNREMEKRVSFSIEHSKRKCNIKLRVIKHYHITNASIIKCPHNPLTTQKISL